MAYSNVVTTYLYSTLGGGSFKGQHSSNDIVSFNKIDIYLVKTETKVSLAQYVQDMTSRRLVY